MNKSIIFDMRCLQDVNYTDRGIGIHARHVLNSVRTARPDLRIVGLYNPSMPSLSSEDKNSVDGLTEKIIEQNSSIYITPSALTHPSSPLISAKKQGLACIGVVHDFIPLREKSKLGWSYNFLLKTLELYDALLPNSDYTAKEIRTYIPDFEGIIQVMHCAPRQSLTEEQGEIAEDINSLTSRPYIFVATADAPRKNPEVVLGAIASIAEAGLQVVVGGGFRPERQAALRESLPTSLREVLQFSPRVDDVNLRHLYREAKLIIVPSLDEGFSLPVAEAVALGSPVVASNIPAHAEQVIPDRLFPARDAGRLSELITRLAREEFSFGRDDYVTLPWEAECKAVGELIETIKCTPLPASEVVRFWGPAAGQRTGIARYNEIVTQASPEALASYEDIEQLEDELLLELLLNSINDEIIIAIGNNELFHWKTYQVAQMVGGKIILHDSRLFEMFLNKLGPEAVAELARISMGNELINRDTIVSWQIDRWKLPISFLDDLCFFSSCIFVHSKTQKYYIDQQFPYAKCVYLPFLAQVDPDVRDRSLANRRSRSLHQTGSNLTIASFGELESGKSCGVIISAIRILMMHGFRPKLTFIGKVDKNYKSQLDKQIKNLWLENEVVFCEYVSVENYGRWLSLCDLAIQLRIPMFGQVSGPVAECGACGIPLITTEDLAKGMDINTNIEAVPSRYSPLHVAMAVKRVLSVEWTEPESDRWIDGNKYWGYLREGN